MCFKNLMKKGMLCCLAIICVFSFSSCKNDDDVVDNSETTLYPNQFENMRYYCQQGYDEATWKVIEGEDKQLLKDITQYADGKPVNYTACGLVAQFTPIADEGKVKYNIFALKGNFMRATITDILLGLVGKSETYKFNFNDLFIEDTDNNPRDAFVWDQEVEDTEESLNKTNASYNKMNYQRVPYKFTVDGVDWQGMMLTTLGKEGFFVITLEAQADLWDTYYSEMEKMLKDFRLRGWEEGK